ANPSDQPVELYSAVHFNHAPEIQLGTRIWVPANSRRTFMVPLRFDAMPPVHEGLSVPTAETTAFLFSGDAAQVEYGEQRGRLMLEQRRPIIGMLTDAGDDMPRRMYAPLRDTHAVGNGLSTLNVHSAPLRPISWTSIDCLVITA